VTTFLVEAYMPATIDVAEVESRVSAAAAELTTPEAEVRYLRSIFVPDDELCMHLFDAASADAVSEVTRRAGISVDRIAEAVPSAIPRTEET
jgi:uncharacterized protein DUF4242